MYKTFSAISESALCEIVNQKRLEGWQYVGGICVVPLTAYSVGALKNLREDVVLNLEEFNYGLVYLQAMEYKEINDI
jgi:hypothetical protein